MLRTFANGTIEWFIDRSRHVVFSRWEGDVTGEEVLAVSPALWRQHLELVRFGAVHDQLDFTGVIEHRYGRELMRLREQTFGDAEPNLRTAVVTADPMKFFELKVVRIEAPANRQFRLFDNNAAALAWVTADEPGNPSALHGRKDGPLPWWFYRATAKA